MALLGALALAACESTPANPDDGAVDQKVTGDGPLLDLGPAIDSALADLKQLDGLAHDVKPPLDASPTATSYLLWQSPGGFAVTGPAIEVFGSGLIRFWKQTKQMAPHGTTGWNQQIQTSPGLVYTLFTLLDQVDFTKLPHSVSPQAECYPVLYWEKCSSCTPVTLSHNKVSGLKPEMDQVLLWFTTNLSALYEGELPPEYCFGA